MTPTEIENESKQELARFEEWFTGLPNEPLSKSEIAILRTFQFWRRTVASAPVPEQASTS